MRKMTSRHQLLIALLCIAATFQFTHAGGTRRWTHTSESDFQAGTFEHVVATNLGDLKLSRASKVLFDQDPRISAVHSLAEMPDGTVYAGTGPQGVLLRVKGDSVETALAIEDAIAISALAVDHQGKLLIGVSGETARVLRLDQPDAKPLEIWRSEEAQYVWSIVANADGNAYIATGPNGQIFAIERDGASRILLDVNENNILSLISDGGDQLYAGTDPNGLVYRIDRKRGQFVVLYDAAEKEISALIRDARGNIYAGTAEALSEDVLEELTAAAAGGRPDRAESGADVPVKAPADREPPDPTPGQPEPEPRDDLEMEGDVESGAGATPTTGPATPAGEDAAASTSNAIYRIDPVGVVTELFRQPLMVLSLIEKDGIIFAGTGSDGYVYQLDPSAEENIVVARLEPRNILSMLQTSDGRILLGLANAGGIASMSTGLASTGTFTSAALDAGQISLFGALHMHGATPPGTRVTVATRSSNVADPSAPGWSPWSAEAPLAEYVPVAAPAGRFLQYRLTLSSDTAGATPVVEDISIAYRVPNLPPVVKSLEVAPQSKAEIVTAGTEPTPPDPEPNRHQVISWEASDPNQDALQYVLHVRPMGMATWILLKDKLTETTYTWDTRTVADGRYELRISANDEASNDLADARTASRRSDPVLVDNTPPVIRSLGVENQGDRVQVRVQAVDQSASVEKIEFTIDSARDWRSAVASDKLFDSPEEVASVVAGGLSPGPHLIVIRATDAKGNQGYLNLPVTAGREHKDK